MEKQDPVTETEEKTQVPVTQTEKKNEGEEVKTFTQEEVNTLLAKERKKMPTKDELKEFNDWKESKKTESQKQTELTENNVNLTNKNTLLEQKLLVSDADVPKKYRDFIQFTVSQMEGDFEENLTEYLKNNPQYLQMQQKEQPSTDGVPITKNKNSEEDGVLAILKAKYPDAF